MTVVLFSGVLILNAFLYWIAVRNIHDKAEMYKDDVRSSEGEFVKYVRESSKEAFTSRAFITFPVSGIQAAIFTNLISRAGFLSGAADQTASALEGIRFGAGVIPFIFVLSGILPMLFTPITKAKEEELSDFSEKRHRVE
jgi:uncharacterized membrane protein SpoIIM required for sporulation